MKPLDILLGLVMLIAIVAFLTWLLGSVMDLRAEVIGCAALTHSVLFSVFSSRGS